MSEWKRCPIKIINPRDAIVKITSTAICGSDLHIYDGYIPTMKSGDILGHEFMGRSLSWAVRSRMCKWAIVVVPSQSPAVTVFL